MFGFRCVFVTQRQRLINTRTLTNGDSDVPVKGGSRRGIENGLSAAERGIRRDGREEGNETENEDNENNENDEEEEDEDRDGPLVPFQCPGTKYLVLLVYLLCFGSRAETSWLLRTSTASQ